MDEEIEQYKQYSEDWRHYEKSIWQIPSVGVTVGAALIGGSYRLNDTFVRGIILLIGSLFSFSLFIALVKHRYFHNRITNVLESIEQKWKGENKIKFLQSRITSSYAKGFQKCKAVNVLYFSIGFVTFVEFALSGYNFALSVKILLIELRLILWC
jgi:hypothetical protein